MAVRILAAMEHLQINNITPAHCLSLLEQLRQPNASTKGTPLAPATILKHYILLNTMFNHAIKWGFIVSNPISKIDPPKKEVLKKDLPKLEDLTEFFQLVMQKATL